MTFAQGLQFLGDGVNKMVRCSFIFMLRLLVVLGGLVGFSFAPLFADVCEIHFLVFKSFLAALHSKFLTSPDGAE